MKAGYILGTLYRPKLMVQPTAKGLWSVFILWSGAANEEKASRRGSTGGGSWKRITSYLWPSTWVGCPAVLVGGTAPQNGVSLGQSRSMVRYLKLEDTAEALAAPHTRDITGKALHGGELVGYTQITRIPGLQIETAW